MSAHTDIPFLLEVQADVLWRLGEEVASDRAMEIRAAVAELIAAVNDLSRDGSASEAEWGRIDAALARCGGRP